MYYFCDTNFLVLLIHWDFEIYSLQILQNFQIIHYTVSNSTYTVYVRIAPDVLRTTKTAAS